MSVPLSTAPLLRSTHRVLAWLRLALAVQTIAFNILRINQVSQPVVLMTLSALTLFWTLVMAQWNRIPPRYRKPLVVVDVVACLVAVLCSRWILGPNAHDEHGFVPSMVYWYTGASLACAVSWGSWVGLVVAAIFGAASLQQAGTIDDLRVWTTSFGICLAAWGAGQMVDQLRRALSERDRSLAASITLGERDRMNRIVHDGALQVLSLVEREGRSLGPRGERLAQLARQQEIQLRSVLQDRAVEELAAEEGPSDVDVAAMLDAMSSDRVTVSVMAGAVLLPAEVARELQAAVAQALLNTELHGGPESESWILLEEDTGQLIISVRDDGVGMTSDQVQAAADAGRLGIRQSIIGRMEDLGGTAEMSSAPGRGVEWELKLPIGVGEAGQPAEERTWNERV